jgi:hypothetical protein
MKCYVNDWVTEAPLGTVVVNEPPELGGMFSWKGTLYKVCRVISAREFEEDYIQNWCGIALDMSGTW